jgi:heme/copper-type cytochrome/quinol oxidase subunit 2
MRSIVRVVSQEEYDSYVKSLPKEPQQQGGA